MSNIFCNCCGEEQMKEGYGLTFCLFILFLTPSDRICFKPSMNDQSLLIILI